MAVAVKYRKATAARISSASRMLARHNTPALIQRRKAGMAESNACHTKKFDDAMTDVLRRFQKLTF
jgi:hypothetical protein